MAHVVELDVAGRTLKLETGRVAKQADGSVWAQYGDTVVLATAVASQNAKPGVDFLPLTVDYQEKAYAAGKIPGGYFKREGRPSEKEVLTSRLIDRPLRPLFPEGYYFETQVIASVLSSDKTGSSDVIGITAASAALAVSDIPFLGPAIFRQQPFVYFAVLATAAIAWFLFKTKGGLVLRSIGESPESAHWIWSSPEQPTPS